MNHPKKSSEFILANALIPFFLVTILFFMWGIPNNLNGILIKQFMKSLELSRFQAGLIQSAFYLGYFVFAVPAGIVMRKYSYKIGIIFGLLLYGTGCLLFYPAAIVGKYGFFLLALFIIASGLAFLETVANTFISLLGSSETSERRLNFSQAFNPIGSVLGVLLGTFLIFSGNEPDETTVALMKRTGEYSHFLQSEMMRVVVPYLGLALFAFIWALLILKTKFPKIDKIKTELPKSEGKFKELYKFPQFWKGVLAQFLYVGAQVGTWSFFIPYVQDYTNQPEKMAGYLLTGTLVAFVLGRFSATMLMRYYKPSLLMAFYSLINILLVTVSILFPGWIGMWAILATSFFMSLMYPTIFATSIKGLGQHATIGGSILVMAIVGGAFCTPLMGYIAELSNSMAIAMSIPLVAYIYIFYFSISVSKDSSNTNPT